MCQAIQEGGRRCPVHRIDSTAIIKLAAEKSGLDQAQTEDLLIELRKEGRHSRPPAKSSWERSLSTMRTVARTSVNADNLREQLQKARTEGNVPDGATFYAMTRLIERSEQRSQALDKRMKEICEETGLSHEEAKARYAEFYDAVDRSRGSEVPEEYNDVTQARARVYGYPSDRSTVVAMEKLAASADRGERRIVRSPTASSFIREAGYDPDGGRLEIVFRSNPDNVLAYTNVPEDVWDRMNGRSLGSVYSREVRGNSDYMYSSIEEAERDAYSYRCASCGQFASMSTHVCPEREERAEAIAAGASIAQVEESRASIREANENGVNDSVPVVEILVIPEEEITVPARSPFSDGVSIDEPLEESGSPSLTPFQQSFIDGTLDEESGGEPVSFTLTEQLEMVDEINRREEEAAREEDATGVEPATGFSHPVEELGSSDLKSLLEEHGAVFHQFDASQRPEAFVSTPENQLNPVAVEWNAREKREKIEVSTEGFGPMQGEAPAYIPRNESFEIKASAVGSMVFKEYLSNSSMTEEEKEEFKRKVGKFGRVVILQRSYYATGENDRHRQVKEYKLVGGYDSRDYEVASTSMYGDAKSYFLEPKANISPAPAWMTADATPEERREMVRNATSAANQEIDDKVSSGQAVRLDSNVTLSKANVVIAGRDSKPQPHVAFAKAVAMKKALKEGKTVVSNIIWNDGGYNDGTDDQGFSTPINQGYVYRPRDENKVTGQVAVRRNAEGLVEVVSSRNALKCECYVYRQNYYCSHIDSAYRHIPNYIQQVAPSVAETVARHRLLTATLASRPDIKVVEADKTRGEYISFGDAIVSGHSIDSRRSWDGLHAATLPPQLRDTNLSVEERMMQAYPIMQTLGRLRNAVSPKNPRSIVQAVKRADVRFPIQAEFGTNYWSRGASRGIVTGYYELEKNTAGEIVESGRSLKCTCADYQENYDCEHVRSLVGQAGMFLNTRSQNWEAPFSTGLYGFRNSNTNAYQRAEYINDALTENPLLDQNGAEVLWNERSARIAARRVEEERRRQEEIESRRIEAEERDRKYNAHREEQAKRRESPDTSLVENFDEFKRMHDEALTRKKKGEAPIEYKYENVTDGICGDGPGARRFGVELEFEIDSNLNKRQALNAIAKDLHEAGLTASASQGYYHDGQRSGYATWSFEHDQTVDGELVSPIMQDTPEHWKQLEKAVTIIKKHGGYASTKAGSHVHVSTGSYGMSTAKHAELLREAKEHEDIMYRMATNPSRGIHRGGRWCKPNIDPHNEDIMEEGETMFHHPVIGSAEHSYAINYESAGRAHLGDKAHAEFRAWDATLDASIIQQQIKMSVAMTELSEQTVLKEKGSMTRIVNSDIGTTRWSEEQLKGQNGGKHTDETFQQINGQTASFVSRLFPKNEHREGLVNLFALTKWQKGDNFRR